MTVIWSKNIANTQYEVRSAGKTLRLYTDGVLHSQHHPDRLFAGSIWDLLMMPALFYKPGYVKRILVLGVGGGAVIHQLRHYVQPEAIDAIDLNPVHLTIARRFFNIKPSMARLIQADGIEWLQKYNGPGYDMIIEDMFSEENGEPVRAMGLNYRWISTLRKHLNPNGVLVVNTMSNRELKQAACFTHTQLSKSFKSVYQLYHPVYANVIGALFRKPVNMKGFRKQISSFPALNQQDIRLRKIK